MVVITTTSLVAEGPAHQWLGPTHIPTFVPNHVMLKALPILMISVLQNLGEYGLS